MNTKRSTLPAFIITTFLIVLYLFIMFQFSLNIPIADDYGIIVNFLNNSTNQKHLFQKIIAQHNEHRVGLIRLISFLSVKFTHTIDFRILITIGNLGYILLFLLIVRIIYLMKKNALFIIPIAFVFFNPLTFENMTWATGSLQNNWVLLFAVLSLYLWIKSEYIPPRLFALFCAVGAVFTSGNGILVFIIIFIYEIAHFLITIKQQKKVSITMHRLFSIFLLLIISIGTLLLYFHNYRNTSNSGNLMTNLSDPLAIIQYIIFFTGAHSQMMSKIAAFILGTIEIIFFIYLIIIKYYKKNPHIFYIILFSYASITLSSLSRIHLGILSALDYRYKTLSIVLFSFHLLAFIEVYDTIFLLKKLKTNYIQGALIVCSLIFCLRAHQVYIPALTEQKNRNLTGMKTWVKTGDGLSHPDNKLASRWLNKAIDNGFYEVPTDIQHPKE